MRAFIYAGGEIYPGNITEHPKSDDLVIAADSGYDNAVTLGERVDLIIGDMDSIKHILPEKIENIKLPAEKDMTDTQYAAETAIARGCDDIVIIGGIGGRLDHTISCMYILEDMNLRGINCVIANGQNRIRFIRSTSTLIAKSGYRYISLLAADETVKGVEIKGCKYPLDKAKLTRRLQYAVSNEIEGNCALISVRKGGIFIIESIDKESLKP